VVSLGAPSLVTIYGSPPALAGALVLGISQSGESPDIVALVEEGRRQGALTVALCNQPDSPLGRAAAHVVDLHAGPEESVAASKSYTAELLALAMLSAAIDGDAEARQALDAIPDAVDQTLARATPMLEDAILAPFVVADRMVVLGRGFNFATAFEAALKIKETSGVMAEPHATPDLFHGPFAMIEAGFPALVIAHSGAAFADATAAVRAIAARGAEILVISDDPSLQTTVAARGPLATPPGVPPGPEWLSPITAIVPGQLVALTLATARSLDADRPVGLAKVTRTH
jgi:glucosamine--fructose-6-phosphate aminotransferase (isomerizing)